MAQSIAPSACASSRKQHGGSSSSSPAAVPSPAVPSLPRTQPLHPATTPSQEIDANLARLAALGMQLLGLRLRVSLASLKLALRSRTAPAPPGGTQLPRSSSAAAELPPSAPAAPSAAALPQPAGAAALVGAAVGAAAVAPLTPPQIAVPMAAAGGALLMGAGGAAAQRSLLPPPAVCAEVDLHTARHGALPGQGCEAALTHETFTVGEGERRALLEALMAPGGQQGGREDMHALLQQLLEGRDMTSK